MPTPIELISFNLCPYVQRSVITLENKGVPYDLKYIDLSDKPDWFLAISPFGKVPVLRVGEIALFESAVINEYLDEVTPPSMHPDDALQKARHRMWIEFASVMGGTAYRLMMSKTKEDAEERARDIRSQLGRLEEELEGPYFSGETFRLVDAAFAPMLQRIAWCEEIAPELGCFEGRPKAQAYCDALLAHPSVQRSLIPEIKDVFNDYLAGAGSPTRKSDPVYLHHRRLAAT